MTAPSLEGTLKDLQQQVDQLQQSYLKDAKRAQQLLPSLLAGVQLTLDELHVAADASPFAGSNEALDPVNDTDGAAARSSFESRFREMAERGSVLVRVMRSETHCQWVNNAFTAYTARNIEDLLGGGWTEAVHPEDRVRCGELLYEVIDRSRLHAIEYRLQHSSGEYRWVLEIGTPWFNSRGNVIGYLGAAIELSRYERTEKHLALQYEVARALSETSAEPDIRPILKLLCERLGWDVAELWAIDGEDRAPRCIEVWASQDVDVSGILDCSQKTSIPRITFEPWNGSTSIWIPDITADPIAGEAEIRQSGLRGMLCVPVLVHGKVYTILRFFSREVRAQDAAAEEFMVAVGAQIGQCFERHRAVEDLRKSEARKAAMLEAALDAVISIDGKGRVVEFNAAAESLFGYRRGDVFGRGLAPLIVPALMREIVMTGFADYLSTGTSDLLGYWIAASMMRSDGTEFQAEIRLVPIGPVGNREPSILTIFVRDTTARLDAEREVETYQYRLRSLMTELLLTEERERRALAVDIHDGLTQTLALIQIKLSSMRRSATAAQQSSFDVIERLVQQANHAARSITFELSPPVLHDLGLEPALRWLVENIQTRYDVEIDLEAEGLLEQADEQTRVILFRSIRELLINAAKHAGTQRVRLRLESDDAQFEAAIEDDGVGMEPEKATVKGSGLFSIQERLNHVGGSMRIESAPGKGTRVRLRAPLASQATVSMRTGS